MAATPYAKSLCQKETEAFGANCKMSNTQQSENGFKVYSYICRHNSKCEFRACIYFPHGTGFDKPVASQLGYEHNCGRVKSWQAHLQGTRAERGNIGLHPLLKACIEEIKNNTIEPYRLPLPDEMVNCIIDKVGDECTSLFPNGCIDIVTNQIREYWRRKRRDFLSSILDVDKMIKYLPELSIFQECHQL
jgi:hypothetical protein